LSKFRQLRLVGAVGATLRTELYNGIEHLVVPVIAMVEGVVWASNSDVPEFVPAEELAMTPHQWNGRGCFAGHPQQADSAVTANTPSVLETSFGVIFDTAPSERILETRRLELEAWLDPAKAALVSEDAANVIARINAGTVVEVSVGCYVEPNEEDGTFGGLEYHGAWRNIVSDHLAFLAADDTGACSIEAGCGAPRVAVRHLVTASGIHREEVPMPVTAQRPARPTPPAPAARPALPPVRVVTEGSTGTEKRSLKERLKGMIASMRAAMSMSDTDLRGMLDAALRASEPGYMWIESVYPDDTQVIYCVSPADEWITRRRKYTLGADGTVTLDATVEDVEPVTTYEPVGAPTTVTARAASSPCSCGGQQAQPGTPPAAQGEVMNKKLASKEKVAELIAQSAGKYTEADAEWLGQIPEDRLETLKTTAPAPAPVAEVPPVPAPVAEPVAAAAKVPTEAEFLAANPSIGAIVAQHKAREASEHAALVTSLKTCGTLTEEQLKAKSLDDLKTLAAFAKVDVAPVDFSARGVPRTTPTTEDFAPPAPYDATLKVLRGGAGGNTTAH
jgi:hypothetical protein